MYMGREVQTGLWVGLKGARNTGVRGLMAVQFFEKKRRKAWFTKGEEEVCWEQWTLDVTLATPRTESGMKFLRRWP